MDIISYSKAMQAKKNIAALDKRLGADANKHGEKDIKDIHIHTKKRLEELEKKRLGMVLESFIIDSTEDYNAGVHDKTTSNDGILKLGVSHTEIIGGNFDVKYEGDKLPGYYGSHNGYDVVGRLSVIDGKTIYEYGRPIFNYAFDNMTGYTIKSGMWVDPESNIQFNIQDGTYYFSVKFYDTKLVLNGVDEIPFDFTTQKDIVIKVQGTTLRVIVDGLEIGSTSTPNGSASYKRLITFLDYRTGDNGVAESGGHLDYLYVAYAVDAGESTKEILYTEGTWISQELIIPEDFLEFDSVEVIGTGLEGVLVSTKSDRDEDFLPLGAGNLIQSLYGSKIQVKLELKENSGSPEVDQVLVKYKVRPLLNRVSEIESQTHINLNKHNLRVSTILNKRRYNLKEMIVDDLLDASGIDMEQSVNIAHDLEGKVKQIDAGLEGSIVTIAENTDEAPTMVSISQVSSANSAASQDFDLSAGVHEGTEFVDGKLQLQKIGVENAEESSLIPVLSGDNGQIIHNAQYTGPHGAFDNNLTTRFASGFGPSVSNPSYLGYDFLEEKVVTKYTIIPWTKDDAPKDWTFQGWDGQQWVELDKKVGETDWQVDVSREFTIAFPNRYTKYRLSVTASVRGGTYYFSAKEVQFIGYVSTDIFSHSGSYETPVIDLTTDLKSISQIIEAVNIKGESEVKIYSATSSDGVNFSNYEEVIGGIVLSAKARFMKVKIELIGDGRYIEKVANDFTEEEAAKFTANEQVLIDGSIHLKINYQSVMNEDETWNQDVFHTGKVFKGTFTKSDFKAIEKIEVI